MNEWNKYVSKYVTDAPSRFLINYLKINLEINPASTIFFGVERKLFFVPTFFILDDSDTIN